MTDLKGKGLDPWDLMMAEILSIEKWPLPSEFPDLESYLHYLKGMEQRHRDSKADLLKIARMKRDLRRTY